jgi:hypothetical protein
VISEDSEADLLGDDGEDDEEDAHAKVGQARQSEAQVGALGAVGRPFQRVGRVGRVERAVVDDRREVDQLQKSEKGGAGTPAYQRSGVRLSSQPQCARSYCRARRAITFDQ